jgi:putative transposase
MTKLTRRKIGRIMRELDKGEMSVRLIAREQGITPRRVRQLREYRNRTGGVFEIKTVRETRQHQITKEEIQTVLTARQEYKSGSTVLERIIDLRYGTHIPHNRIQRILDDGGFTKPLKKKVKRHVWIRYERKHSNSMWHADWTVLDDGKWLITYEDDASRKIVAWGEFDNATSEHSVEVLKRGIESHGKPREILTGHDIQFYAVKAEGKEQGETVFQKYLKEQEITHILGRVNHPQTNGKEERTFGTIKSKRHEFESMEKLVRWYNEIRPHMSLNFDVLETPAQAFIRKMHHTGREGLIFAAGVT